MTRRKSFLLQVLFQILLVLEVLNGTVHAAGKKYALVIGVQNYDPTQLTSLQYSEADAVAIGESLEKLGFDVIVMTRQASIPERVPTTADDILTQIQRRVRDRDPDDTIVIMLSGHGVQLKSDALKPDGTRESYFCAERANLNDRSTLLPLSQIVSVVQECKARRKLLLVDACRNEVEPKAVADKGGSPVTIELDPAGVTRRTIPQGMVALFSCSSKERSFEMSDLQHSVFSYNVLQYLNGKADSNRYPQRELQISEMATFVSRETRDYIDRQLGKDQTPELLLPGGGLTDWPLGRLGEPADLVTNSIGMTLKLIPAGEFLMGSPDTEEYRSEDEGPQHRVRINMPFYMGVTEVTQGQWSAVMGTKPWAAQEFLKEGADYPVTNVSWDDAVEFCRTLSGKEGKTYRLPTEAEWEYACRGGTTTAYSFGTSETTLDEYAWHHSNTVRVGEIYAHKVGARKANPFGLHDIHGNVWEWCSDWYGPYQNNPMAVDPTGPRTGTGHVSRGGGWGSTSQIHRSSIRSIGLDVNNKLTGFRIVKGTVD